VTTAASVVPTFPQSAVAKKALTGSATIWFITAVIGQWTFLYYIIAFYGASIVQGNFQSWSRNKFLFKGYVPGDTIGNLYFAAHVLLAAVITFGGALQLMPQIRARAISVHRWNGRLFLLTAGAASIAGLWLVWVRRSNPTLDGAIAVSGNALLIIIFAALAWRSALLRDIPTHRRWALRAYIAANGVWFERVGFFAWIIVNRGQVGLHMFFRFWEFGCYLLPLAVLELYLRTKDGSDRRAQFAMAACLVILTVLMGIGIFGVAMFGWLPLLAKT